jgi:hypothetical protein
MNKYKIYFRGDAFDGEYQAWREDFPVGSYDVKSETERSALEIAKNSFIPPHDWRVCNLRPSFIERIF